MIKTTGIAAMLALAGSVAATPPAEDVLADEPPHLRKPIVLTDEQVRAGLERFSRCPFDYAGPWRREVGSIPEDDRAWPLVEELNELEWSLPELDPPWYEAEPGDAGWEEVIAWVSAHPAHVSLVERIAARPRLGFEPRWDAHDGLGIEWQGDPPVLDLLLPHLGSLRQAVRLEAVLARRAKNGANPADAIEYLERMEHLSTLSTDGPPAIIMQLVGWACDLYLAHEAADLIADRGDNLTHDDLVRIDAALVRTACRDGIDYAGERMYMDDLAARLFGSDRASLGTCWAFFRRTAKNAPDSQATAKLDRTYWVFASTGSASGALAFHDWIWTTADTFQTTEPWLRRDPTPSAAIQERIKRSRLLPWKPGAGNAIVASALMPNLELVYRTQACRLDERRGVRLALALHRHRLRHGAWPPTIADLDADFRPDDITDIHTGDPLLYKLTDAGPVVYSAGPDRDDDDARPLLDDDGNPDTSPPVLTIDEWHRRLADDPASIDGDWILYPPQD